MKHFLTALEKLMGKDHPFVEAAQAMSRDFEEQVAQMEAEHERRVKEMEERRAKRQVEWDWDAVWRKR